MRDDALERKKATETHVTGDETPRGRLPMRIGEWRLDVVLAVLGVALAVAFVGRRPFLALLAVAFFFVGYALVRLWHRYDEHPGRGRRFRRTRSTRNGS
jgi:hypothetical protein